MYFTWSDIFIIIENSFDMKQKEIAKYLDVSPSTISRLIKKKTREPESAIRRDLYSKIFDPANGLLQEKEVFLLDLLKNEIKKINRQEVMNDLWTEGYKEGDYEKFVKKMLERTRKNSRPDYIEPTDKINDPFLTYDFYKANPDTSVQIEDEILKSQIAEAIRLLEKGRLLEGSVSVMRERFIKALKKYHIAEFLDDATEPYDEITLTNVNNFLQTIDDDTKSFKQIMIDKHKEYLENKWGKSYEDVITEMPGWQISDIDSELNNDKTFERRVKYKIEKFSDNLKRYKGRFDFIPSAYENEYHRLIEVLREILQGESDDEEDEY